VPTSARFAYSNPSVGSLSDRTVSSKSGSAHTTAAVAEEETAVRNSRWSLEGETQIVRKIRGLAE
jgi:hypothetical protein